ncbi:unnamed protein product, partial [Schistosoma rodhaini]|uniref:Uncharacterized protein n=1 Tax=Schistosoma rodhaini TaxID=6188 RepID=A0AA85GBD0_9TREM
MKYDVLIDFYLVTVRAQMCELQLVGLNEDDAHYGVVMRAVESVRREVGSITFRLLNAALPTNARHKRLFRTKYIEDVDLRNIENCLVSAANKVINFNSSQSHVECDLGPAKSSASEFLDTHGRVQALVAHTIESCLDSLSSNHTEDGKLELNKQASNNSTEQNNFQASYNIPHETKDSPNCQKKNIRGHRNVVDRDSSEFSNTHRINSPLCSLPVPSDASNSNSLEQQSAEINDENSKIINVSVQVNIASVIYTTPVKLPSSKFLTISPELFHTLLELDYCAARFEFDFVRCVSRRIRTLQEADDVQIVTVLFSETLMWGLTVKLLSIQQLTDRDPCVLLALPRLSILVGCRLLPDSPIGANRLAVGHRLPFMFSSSRSELAYLCRQLFALRPDQLCRLTRWLGPNGLPNLIYNQKLSSRLSDSEQQTNPNCSLQEVPNEIKTTTTTTRGSRMSLSSLLTPSSVPNNLIASYQKSHIWKTCLPGLHRLYKSISSVADRFAREYPTELRFILQKVIEMHDTNDEIDIDESFDSSSMNNNNNNLQNANPILSDNTSDNIVDKSIEEIKNKQLIDEENELEEELELNLFNLIASERKLRDLANLFNWNEVMQYHRRDKLSSSSSTSSSLSPNQFNVHKLFKESNLYLRNCTTNSTMNKFSYSNDTATSNCLIKSSEPFDKHTGLISEDILNDEKTTVPNSNVKTTVSIGQTVDEIGLDIAACLDDDNDDVDNLIIYTNSKSISPVNNNHNQHSTFSQRLQALNLSISFEGTQNPTDHIFNYLPAWQPDSPSYENHIDQLKFDNHDGDDDSIDLNDLQCSYIVGRNCASCNRPFTL